MKPLEHLPPRPRPEEPMHVPPKPAPDKQPPSQEPPQEKGDKRPGRDKQVLMEESMNASYFVHGSASFALAVLLAGCATWNDMNRQEKAPRSARREVRWSALWWADPWVLRLERA